MALAHIESIAIHQHKLILAIDIRFLSPLLRVVLVAWNCAHFGAIIQTW